MRARICLAGLIAVAALGGVLSMAESADDSRPAVRAAAPAGSSEIHLHLPRPTGIDSAVKAADALRHELRDQGYDEWFLAKPMQALSPELAYTIFQGDANPFGDDMPDAWLVLTWDGAWFVYPNGTVNAALPPTRAGS